MPKVYVVNDSGHDFSAAKQFGSPIVFLSEGEINRYNVNQMFRRFSAGLEDSEPDDWILATSLTQMNMVAAAIFAAKHGRLNLLIHRYKTYAARSIVLDGSNT